MLETLNKAIFHWGSYTLNLRMIVSAIIVFVLFKILSFLIKYIFFKQLKKKYINNDRLNSIFQLLSYFLWTIGILIIIDQMGVKLTFILAGSAALLVGLGLGIQQTFNDIISGIIILMEGSIKIDDVVEVDNMVGKVIEIKLRTSLIYSRDGINVIVPNHKFINENVINWSHNNKATRFRVQVGVDYSSDEHLVKNVLMEALKQESNIIFDNPEYPILIRIVNFGNSSIDFEILFWSNEIFAIEEVKSNIRFFILKKFRENNVIIPFPQTDLHIKSGFKD